MVRFVRTQIPMLSQFVLLLILFGNVLLANPNRSLSARRYEYASTMDVNSEDFTCRMQPNGYMCSSKLIYRYYYDVKWQGCKSFLHGRCHSHNENYYNTKEECKQSCENLRPVPQKMFANLSKSVVCVLQPEFGDCYDYQPSWYFDVTARTCKGFSYSGCGGNPNRFPTAKDCNGHCSSIVFPDKIPVHLP